MHMCFSPEQFQGVSAALSVGFAAPGAVTIFLFLQLANLDSSVQSGPVVSGIVTLISSYSSFEIRYQWDRAFLRNKQDGQYYVKESGPPLADALRYTDWVITVPLLLLELVFMMEVPNSEKQSLIARLGGAAVIMVAAGFPGELAEGDRKTRWKWFGISCVPYMYLVFTLLLELGDATERQPTDTRGMFTAARYLTILSWMMYPAIYVAKCVGLQGAKAVVFEQIGYTAADIISKAVFGILMFNIAMTRTNSINGR